MTTVSPAWRSRPAARRPSAPWRCRPRPLPPATRPPGRPAAAPKRTRLRLRWAPQAPRRPRRARPTPPLRALEPARAQLAPLAGQKAVRPPRAHFRRVLRQGFFCCGSARASGARTRRRPALAAHRGRSARCRGPRRGRQRLARARHGHARTRASRRPRPLRAVLPSPVAK